MAPGTSGLEPRACPKLNRRILCQNDKQVSEVVMDVELLQINTSKLQDLGLKLAISGVHPFSRWEEQRIIDTEHYRRVEGELGYVAWTNNTWSVHLHCGIRGADRDLVRSCGWVLGR